MNRPLQKKPYLILTLLLMTFSFSGFVRSGETDLSKNSPQKKQQKENTFDYYNKMQGEPLSLGEVGLKMLSSLGVVLLLLVITVFVIRRFYSGSVSLGGDKNMKLIRLIEKLPISPKQSMHLFWAVDRILVVAVNQNSMTLITEIKDQNVLEKVPTEFSDMLTKQKINFSELYHV